ADCHTTAYDIWKDTPHATAIDSIVNPPERYETARHFDPECISCHVVGWEPQKYFPFEDGYMDLKKSKHLHHVGCENCHGPGSAHIAAEEEADDEEVLKMLRAQMRISKETMKTSFERGCVQCHDLDNDPNFVFEEYWPEVEHYGKD
ncbi:MAG: cytochrome c family protein, partial [Pirellulales bacterium]|nr:cytochrome c family protein [Pirellulales bacterium]